MVVSSKWLLCTQTDEGDQGLEEAGSRSEQ